MTDEEIIEEWLEAHSDCTMCRDYGRIYDAAQDRESKAAKLVEELGRIEQIAGVMSAHYVQEDGVQFKGPAICLALGGAVTGSSPSSWSGRKAQKMRDRGYYPTGTGMVEGNFVMYFERDPKLM